MRASRAGFAAVTLVLAGCAHLPADEPADPLEPVNRAVYRFNETADRFVLRPVAKGYDAVVPSVARTGVRNFFSNLFYPTVIVNDVLQLKMRQAGQDFVRFVLNTTFGLGGLFDIATPTGLPANDEDFGQTLGYWGVGEGWYIVLPLLGPSSNRDVVGRVADIATNPISYVNSTEHSLALGALSAVETRAGLLSADKFLEQQLDRYVFVRTIYLQSRHNKVHDGSPPAEDYGFEPEEEPPPVEPAPEWEESPTETQD